MKGSDYSMLSSTSIPTSTKTPSSIQLDFLSEEKTFHCRGNETDKC